MANYFYLLTLPAVRQHSGWQSVRLFGRRYQLFGGIRGAYFVNLDRPLGA